MLSKSFFFAIILCSFVASGFAPVSTTKLRSSIAMSQSEDDMLAEKFGGYTVKQRLREEIESPFRQVRLIFFGGSAGSALTALYFSVLSVVKANMGYTDGPSLDEALTNCAVNLGGAIICALLAFREWKAGEANLARIAKGGALAKLRVSSPESLKETTLKDYRRNSRVLVAAGGREYISVLARSLNSDQLADENNLPQLIEEVDVMVIPVLLEDDATRVGPTMECWLDTKPEETDRNFDITKSNRIVSFPTGNSEWMEYLESEISTAKEQGFDVMAKGFTITVKKNGRILRRATGQPQWPGLIETMEVMDGSKFGMPGDSEKYGGP